MGVITFNGITSKDLGVEVETFPNYEVPEKEYQVTHVPGRNGDLVVDTKTFQNVPRSYEVSVATNGVPIEVVNAAVARFKSSSRIPIKSLSSEIKSIQDLHGYDKPWVGGAGKNKLEVTGSSTTVSGVTFTVNDDGTILVNGTATANIQYNVISNWSAFPSGNYILNGCPSGLSNMNLYVNPDRTHAYYDNGSGVSFSVTSEIIVRISMASGVTADNLLFKPMIRLASETDPTFEPYENICPINGFTEANIVNTQIEEIRELFTIDPSFRGRVNFNQFVVNGNFTSTSNWVYNRATLAAVNNIGRLSNFISINPFIMTNPAIQFKANHKFIGLFYARCDTTCYVEFSLRASYDRKAYKGFNIDNTMRLYGCCLSLIDNCDRVLIDSNYANYNSNSVIEYSKVMLFDITSMFGDTIADYIYNLEQSEAGAGIALFKSIYPNDYYAYNSGTNELVGARDGTTYNIPFGQTVYGGHFDNKGNLVVTHGYHQITGTENWEWSKSSYYSGGFFTPVTSVGAKASTPFICTHARTATSISNYEWGTCYCDNSLNFRIMQASDTVADWKNYLASQYANGTPVSICYELYNPIVLPITSQDIPTLLGENNIYSNCGDVSVKVEPSFSTIINQVAEWLHSASGYARLEDTYEPDYYRMAYYSESLSVENLFNEAGKATLNFICKPQRYLKSGETPISFTEEGTIQNGTRFSSSPILKVITDNTQGSISIGNHRIAIKAGAGTDQITIDCELQDAWSGTTNKNPFIILTDGEFPVIDPGIQTITFDGGVQSVEVTPRWWTV